MKLSREFYWIVSIASLTAVVVWGGSELVRRERDREDASMIPKNAVVTPEIQLLADYVQIDTSNPPGHEMAAAKFLLARIESAGVKGELIEAAPGRANVYARIRGRRNGEGLLLLNHIDVVPAKAADWTSPPFAAQIHLNMMWGRGTLDMKGIAICHLLAFIEIARSGVIPERDVVFLATADEETGSKLGIAWLIEHRPDIFEGLRFGLNEGGITETKVEKVTYFGVETGSKQFVQILLRSPGREPLERARIALEPYFEPRIPHRVLPEVREFFRRIAPHRIHARELLIDIDKAIAEGRFWSLQPGFQTLTQNTIFAKGIGESPDGGYSLEVVLSNLPDEDPEALIERFREIGAIAEVSTEVLMTMRPAPISSTKSILFAQIREAVRSTYGDIEVGPMLLPFSSTDSRYTRALGIETYGFWPFPVDFYQAQGIHSVDERIRLDWFMKGVDLTSILVRRYVGAVK